MVFTLGALKKQYSHKRIECIEIFAAYMAVFLGIGFSQHFLELMLL